jgi:prephenate dehydratase
VSYSELKPRVAFQGQHGAFSEEAAIKLLGPAIELVPRRTFVELFSSVEEDRADYVLAPVENSLAGAITATIDLLSASGLPVVDEVVIKIEQQLIGCSGAAFDDIEAVESHPVALAQCQRFFAGNPQITRIESDDTAGSVARIMGTGDRKRAAIASRRAAEIYGGSILRENVEDDPENYTRFLLLSRYGEKITTFITERSAVAPDAGRSLHDFSTVKN